MNQLTTKDITCKRGDFIAANRILRDNQIVEVQRIIDEKSCRTGTVKILRYALFFARKLNLIVRDRVEGLDILRAMKSSKGEDDFYMQGLATFIEDQIGPFSDKLPKGDEANKDWLKEGLSRDLSLEKLIFWEISKGNLNDKLSPSQADTGQQNPWKRIKMSDLKDHFIDPKLPPERLKKEQGHFSTLIHSKMCREYPKLIQKNWQRGYVQFHIPEIGKLITDPDSVFAHITKCRK